MSREHTSKFQNWSYCSWGIWNSRSPTVESDWRKCWKCRSSISRGQSSYDYRYL